MQHPAFCVAVADLQHGPIQVRWTVPQAWLRSAFSGTDARPVEDGLLELELTTNGAEVVVRGTATAAVTMPCARTLEAVSVTLTPEIFLLLTRRVQQPPQLAANRRHRRQRRRRNARSATRSTGSRTTRSKNRAGWDADPLLTPNLAAEDTYDGEQLVLDAFLREFLLLELPMSPLRSDLPLGEDAAIRPPSREQSSLPSSEPSVDPRLAPLAAIASRLRQDKE